MGFWDEVFVDEFSVLNAFHAFPKEQPSSPCLTACHLLHSLLHMALHPSKLSHPLDVLDLEFASTWEVLFFPDMDNQISKNMTPRY
jgi:hypothetical protein